MNDTAKTTDINEEPMMKNVCAYCRVSTNIPHQKGSYESQLEYYENMIRSKADWNFVGIYADYGKSGTKEKGRTDFMRMLEDCEAGEIDIICTKSISRFARNTVECIQVVRKFTEKAPIATELVMRVFEKGNTSYADAYYNGSIDCAGISFEPTNSCIATVVIGKDLSAIDTRFSNILPVLQDSLGTESSSYIEGQEVSVHYFYQNRSFRVDKTEEAYQYYAYYEREGLQYLYQFSSNWSLIDQNVSAIHNPPSTLHYVETQDECRKQFVDYLLILL